MAVEERRHPEIPTSLCYLHDEQTCHKSYYNARGRQLIKSFLRRSAKKGRGGKGKPSSEPRNWNAEPKDSIAFFDGKLPKIVFLPDMDMDLDPDELSVSEMEWFFEPPLQNDKNNIDVKNNIKHSNVNDSDSVN